MNACLIKPGFRTEPLATATSPKLRICRVQCLHIDTLKKSRSIKGPRMLQDKQIESCGKWTFLGQSPKTKQSKMLTTLNLENNAARKVGHG